MKKILVFTCDLIGEKMAGPAVRALEIARILAEKYKVEISCPEINGELPRLSENLSVSQYGITPRWNDLDVFDAVMIPASMNVDAHIKPPLIVDLYDPFILSNLPRTDKSESIQIQELNALKRNLRRGDYFVCASQRQRDFWLGMLAAEGRVNIHQFKANSNLDDLVQLAPFGIPEDLPVDGARQFPGDPEAFRLVWAGGIWDWFDPLTLIRALDKLNKSGTNVVLYFMGTRHPNPSMTKMLMAQQAKELASESGLINKTVFFGDWIPYHERGEILCKAHAGISIHYPHLETHFSYRTRILDYIWARLPYICTEGDTFGDIAFEKKVGIAVKPENVDVLTDAISRLVSDSDYYSSCIKNLESLAVSMHWKQVLQPLIDFCANPHFSNDTNRMILNSEEEISDFIGGCEVSRDPAHEILGTGIEQSLKVAGGGLCRIDLKLATFDRLNTGTGIFELFDSKGRSLVVIPFDLGSVEDNKWRKFHFGPVSRLPNDMIRLNLAVQGAISGNTITIWTDPDETESTFRLNGQVYPGSINYRLYSDDFPESDRELFIKSDRFGFRRRITKWLRK